MAIIKITYCTGTTTVYPVYYDNVAHSVVFNDDAFTTAPCSNPKSDGDTIYTQTEGNTIYSVIARPSLTGYYASVNVSYTSLCSANISSVSTVNESYPGALDGEISITAFNSSTLEFWITGKAWQSSPVFNGLSAGTYQVKSREAVSQCESTAKLVTVGVNNNLSVSFTKTNLTAAGADDGTITLTVSGGSGTYSYLWSDASTSKDRSGLSAGTYSVDVTDTVTGQVVSVSGIQITEPAVVEPPPIYFEVPKMQSFQFVQALDYSQNPAFNYFDKMLHADFYINTFEEGFCYNQIVTQGDNNVPVQVRSSRSDISIDLIDDSGNIVNTYFPELTYEGTEQLQQYNVRLQNNGSDQTRIYFTGSSSIPIPVEAGDSLEIVNNADGFNGIYSVLSIGLDTITGEQYLVINKLYNIVAGSSNALANFTLNQLSFNVYEAYVDFSVVNLGYYYLKAYVSSEEAETVHYSEPIRVVSENRHTNLIEWTNIDNAFDIDYSSGITHRMRVESVFFKRIPKSESTLTRNTDGKRTLLTGKMQRGILLELYDIPPYMIEKIAVALRHDVFKVNGLEYTSEEGLEEPEYTDQYGLANARALLEQKEWFGTYNGLDLGGLSSETGFITTETGFIKR